MKELNGYLEYNGLIYKIQSIEQLRDFVNGLGEKAMEMTEQELAELCQVSFRDFEKLLTNDDGIDYSQSNRLVKGVSDVVFNAQDAAKGAVVEYKIKEGTVAVCDNAFNTKGVQRRRNIYMPNSVVAIGNSAFYGSNIQDVVWSQALKYIGTLAFYGCKQLKTKQGLDLPKSLVYIGAEAFENCYNVLNVEFPNSVKKIGSYAFKNCDSLEWVYIPDTIIEMGSGVFDKCDNLKEIRIPKGSRAKFEKLLPFSVDKFVEV